MENKGLSGKDDTILTEDQKVKEIFAKDPRIVSIRVYHDGWVPNSYKYRAPGKMTVYFHTGSISSAEYDRKRSHGQGPHLVAFSAAGGRLYSE